jgi:hypothetical protein
VLPYVVVVPAVASFPAIADVSSVDGNLDVAGIPAVAAFLLRLVCLLVHSNLPAVHDIPAVAGFPMVQPSLLGLGLASLCTSAVILLLLTFLQRLMSLTANNFGRMYSRKRISQTSFPNFIYIFPKSFMIFCQELSNPKRNYKNQI